MVWRKLGCDPKLFCLPADLKFLKIFAKADWSLKFPRHHIRIRWGPCLRKKGGVCLSPIKNFSYHLLFPTAIVTVDTCTNVNVVYDKCTHVNVSDDKLTLSITYVPLKIYRGLVQTKKFFV